MFAGLRRFGWGLDWDEVIIEILVYNLIKPPYA